MKVVHIGYKYGLGNTGGAAVASTRLHQALIEAGMESHYVCVWKCEEGKNVHVLPFGWRRRLYFLLSKFMRHIWEFTPFGGYMLLNIVPMFGLEKFLKQIDPDVVHVQWINADVASFEQLGRLREVVKPSCKIVFNLHDLYVLLPEGWGYPQSQRYKEGVDKMNSTLLERWMFARKNRMIKKLDPIFIGPSEWVCRTCQESLIGRGRKTHAISNLIDSIFKYYPEKYSTSRKFIILFGCFGGRGSSVKGWKDLVAAIKFLPREVRNNSEIHVFGENGVEETVDGIPVKVLGDISDPERLLEVYHKADVFAFPSVQETQGMTKCEALCCGLPVIAFDRTACAEGIQHGVTGWIAKDADMSGFAQGILYFYHQRGKRQRISDIARRNYDARVILSQILNVYRSEICNLEERGGCCNA